MLATLWMEQFSTTCHITVEAVPFIGTKLSSAAGTWLSACIIVADQGTWTNTVAIAMTLQYDILYGMAMSYCLVWYVMEQVCCLWHPVTRLWHAEHLRARWFCRLCCSCWDGPVQRSTLLCEKSNPNLTVITGWITS